MNCPKCKKEVPDGSAYCMHCGEPVDKSHTSNRKIAIIALILCVLLLALNIFQFINNKNLRMEYYNYKNSVNIQTENTAGTKPVD